MEEERLAHAMSAGGAATVRPERVVQVAREMVAIPSVNGEEGALAAYIARTLQAAGLRVQVSEVAPGRSNVLALWPGAQVSTPLDLLFHGHMDTVPPYGMADPFDPRLEGGTLWGRGSVDQKGGLAAAVAALEALATADLRPAGGIGLAAVIDEESEHRGSMALAKSGLTARAAIVTEPSNLRVVLGCKGTAPLRLTVRGRAAHGARPWLGVNAVQGAMRIAEDLMRQPMPSVELPGLGTITASLNLGVMEGGVAYNIVPDRCLVWFDRRTIPGESQEQVLAAAKGVLQELKAADPGLDAEVEIARPDWHWPPIAERGLKPASTPEGAPLVAQVARWHQEVVGSPAVHYFTDGYNEMDFLINDMGIPTLQYGPGDGGLCHTDVERLEVAQLVAASRVYLALALDLAGAPA